MKYLMDHLSDKLDCSLVENLTFRGGKLDYQLQVFEVDNCIFERDKNHDIYFYSFLKCAIFRENCYHCCYAKGVRCGDITLGDFWKIDRATLKSIVGKVSVILVNTEKGRCLLGLAKEELSMEKRDISEAIMGNAQLQRPAIPHKKRKRFIAAYIKANDFDKAARVAGIDREMHISNVKRTKVYIGLWRAKEKLINLKR